MGRLLFPLLAASSALLAQSVINPSILSPRLRDLVEKREGGAPLRCDVTPLRPALNFGFRFQTGYVARVPLQQFFGRGRSWAVVVKIKPEGTSEQEAKPTYLATRLDLPEIPQTKVEAEIGGGYLVGEGRYRVEWTLIDDQSRVCRKDWNMKADLSRGERSVKVALPPNSVAALSARRPTENPGSADARPLRLTVLLHAAPLIPRRTKLRPSDTLMLLGSLSALLDQMPAKSIRLVVFNLDQQREIIRDDNYDGGAFDRVARAMNEIELGSVDYRVLENTRGHIGLISELVRKEREAEEPSDAVLFMGPMSRYADKPPEGLLERFKGQASQFFYFQFKPYLFRSADLPDTIQYSVNRLKGKTSIIHSPGEFARAIKDLQERVAGAK